MEIWRQPEQAAMLGSRGADGVRAHHTIARMTDRMLEVYGELTGANQPSRAVAS